MAIYKNTPPIITNGLILHLDAANKVSYPDSGTNWNDLSGNGYNGVLTNGPVFNNSNGGNFVFDGSNDYVEISSTALGSSTGNFSCGCWVNHGSSVSTDYFFTRGRDGNGDGWSILVGASESNPMAAVVTTNPSTSQISAVDFTTIYQPNTWYHIFCTWQAGVAVKCYVNGVLKKTTTTSSTVLRSSTIGWSVASIWTLSYASINVASVMAYSRLLSDIEILQNYNALKSRFNL